ncbi:MAG TPA: translation initiation factor IF-2 [Verrucomicrobiae bacterium]|jgi:translation initiation factor IF-2|nr:translation initiation factor IF-2 [Verrucomicrobiae bacterium]
MPVRIYDIAKKYGLENKQILEKAKSLGIAAAKVPSSSLDKISAGWLEEELIKQYPELAAKFAPQPVPEKPKPAPVDDEIKIISAPPPPPPAPVAPAPAPVAPAPAMPAPAPVAPEAKVEPAAPAPPPPPEKPKPAVPQALPPKPAPKVGEKVGFIQLPSRPQQPSRGGDRGGAGAGAGKMPPHRPGAPPPRREEQRGRDGQRDGRSQPPREAAKPAAPAAPKFVAPETGEIITIKPPIVVRDLANALKQKPFIIIGDLMKLGVFATVNQAIDEKIARQICAKYGFRFEVEKRERGAGVVHATEKKVELDFEDKIEELKPRAPVVTIMGHVDHGKTTLLDVIRKTNVAGGEAGGITQHIGAYTISVPHPERKNDLMQITFLDTPGHAAFSSMRARGANVTDVVVLVVAANDGVMPQTLEALNHAKAAKVPILVAVNKIDHPNANAMKVRQQLQDKGLVPDDWGGETIFVDVSALTRQGIDKLLEMILLQADLLELKANPNRRAKGNVIESGVEPGGPTATVLVRKGTLHVSDIILCGEYYGRVRALINEEGQRLKEAGPSVAVKVLGLNGVPDAGLEFSVVEDEKAARELAAQREFEARLESQEDRKVTLENLFATLQAAQSKVLKVVVKADTQGSVEAIVEALKKIESEKVSLEVIHSDVGAITENDVALASASNGIILGFHTRVDSTAAEKAKRESVQIKLYAIIYELIDQVKEAMAGLLEPDSKETIVGSAEVRKIFELSKGAPVAGCMVSSGRIVRGKVRVRRRKDVIYEGVTQSLRRFQDEVNEVRAGMECGIRIEGFGDCEVGDMIECYSIEKVAAKL